MLGVNLSGRGQTGIPVGLKSADSLAQQEQNADAGLGSFGMRSNKDTAQVYPDTLKTT